jgi:hypothetical protein
MKLHFCIILITLLSSCSNDKSSNITNGKQQELKTSIIKRKNALNNSYDSVLYSRSYSYHRIFGVDTLDFTLNAMEYKVDSTFHLNVHHKGAMLFATMLEKLTEYVPFVKEDFEFSRLNSISLESPMRYLDLSKVLSKEYEQKFGKKRVSHDKLDLFLLHSTLNKKLDRFLITISKQAKSYSIEKFQLRDKKYFAAYISETDLKDYPDLTLEGMGVYVQLTNR